MASEAFIIQSEGLGRGDDRLGALLMANFLRLLGESDAKPAVMIFWNAGVRLLCEGSPGLGHVKNLAEQGIDIRACTTCLEYFGLEDSIRVGRKSTMSAAIETMLNSEVVTL